MNNRRGVKVSIVGLGRVGMTTAYSMMLDGTPSEIVLVSREKQKAMGEQLDLEHALPLLDYVKIRATDDYKDVAGSQLVVIAAGAAQKPEQTRLELCSVNRGIMQQILPQVEKYAPEAVILIVSNPVDVLTQVAHEILPHAKGRIFGSGTTLDTARFRYHLSEQMDVDPHSVHAYILGEHGDSSFPVYTYATVGGQKLLNFPNMSRELILECYQQARNAAANIIQAKGATYYAIATVVTKLMEAILSDSKTVFPLSVPLDGRYGIRDVCLSVPCVLGARGVERILEVELSEEEEAALHRSAEVLRNACR